MPTRVLFVCLGNICRSPMAEFVLRDLVTRAGLSEKITTASAGTSGWHNGEDMHLGTKKILKAHRIRADGFRSSQVRTIDGLRYEHIIAMDNKNLAALKALLSPASTCQLYKLTDLLPQSQFDYVPDPYFSGNFKQTYQLVYAGCEAWLAQWQQQTDEHKQL